MNPLDVALLCSDLARLGIALGDPFTHEPIDAQHRVGDQEHGTGPRNDAVWIPAPPPHHCAAGDEASGCGIDKDMQDSQCGSVGQIIREAEPEPKVHEHRCCQSGNADDHEEPTYYLVAFSAVAF